MVPSWPVWMDTDEAAGSRAGRAVVDRGHGGPRGHGRPALPTVWSADRATCPPARSASGSRSSALVALAADWLVPLRLIDSHGNLGSADFGPAEMDMIEARLTPAGLLAVEHAEALDGPVALVVGDLAVGGRRPPFSMDGVQAALRATVGDPKVDDATLQRLVGPPIFVGDSDAEGRVQELLEGRRAVFRLRLRCSPFRPTG